MVGILLAPGLAVQARVDTETARRLHVVQKMLLALEQGDIFELNIDGEDEESQESGLQGHVPDELIDWLRNLIDGLFTAADLPTSLRSAGLTRRDLDWIAASELRGELHWESLTDLQPAVNCWRCWKEPSRNVIEPHKKTRS